MLKGALGAAWTYGTTAYTYNLGKYQFDAGQHQASAHQTQNARISLWNLFREDMRDLFGITTTNMGTYTVMGTLFLGFIVNMVWNAVKDFPEDPPWMILIYCNCLLSSIAFGVLSVWLAMHGTIAAHVASVKVLLQAVRPPIPSSADVASVGTRLAQYEGSGALKLLQVPNLFGWQSGVGSASARQGDAPCKAEAAGAASQSHAEAMRAAQLLSDDDGGPGASALLGSHIDLFQQLQPSYLSFEAYARVSLTVAAHELLLVFGYFMLAHMFAWRSDATGFSKHPALVGWMVVLFLAFVSSLLFRLDTYVRRASYVRLTALLFLSPLSTCIAVSLWSWRSNCHRIESPLMDCDILSDSAPKYAALATCILHGLFEVLVVWEARPDSQAMLPMSFRAVQYTDIFGWWYKHDNVNESHACGASSSPREGSNAPEVQDTVVLEDSAAEQLENIHSAAAKLLSHRVFDLLPQEDRCKLNTLQDNLKVGRDSLQAGLRSRRESSYPSQNGAPGSRSAGSNNRSSYTWVRCEHKTDVGQVIPYYVNVNTADIQWEAPENTETIDLRAVVAMVSELSKRLTRMEADQNQLTPDRSSEGSFNAEVELQEMTSSRREPHRPSIFSPIRRSPNSRRASSSLAWKHFLLVGRGVVVLWICTSVWIMIWGDDLGPNINKNDKRADQPQACTRTAPRRELFAGAVANVPAERLMVPWPRPVFQPSGLACSGRMIALGERFGVASIITERWLTDMDANAFSPMRHLGMALRSFSLVVRDHHHRDHHHEYSSLKLVIMEPHGEFVEEYPRGHDFEPWKVGVGSDFKLRAVTVVQHEIASSECAFIDESVRPSWALYAITTTNEIVSLCPSNSHALLLPARSIAHSDHSSGEFTSVAADSEGNVWIVAKFSSRAELRYLSRYGQLKGVWKLPAGREWSTGLCVLGEGKGILATAVELRSGHNNAELWKFLPEAQGTSNNTAIKL